MVAAVFGCSREALLKQARCVRARGAPFFSAVSYGPGDEERGFSFPCSFLKVVSGTMDDQKEWPVRAMQGRQG